MKLTATSRKLRLRSRKRTWTLRRRARILALPAKGHRPSRMETLPSQRTVRKAQGAGEVAVVVVDAADGRMNATTGPNPSSKPRSRWRKPPCRALSRVHEFSRAHAATSVRQRDIPRSCCLGNRFPNIATWNSNPPSTRKRQLGSKNRKPRTSQKRPSRTSPRRLHPGQNRIPLRIKPKSPPP